MLPKVINTQDLEEQIQEKIIYKNLLLQINKDFQLIGIDFDCDTNTSFDVFFQSFKELIEDIVNSDFELFLNLLYRIDLDETKIRNIIQSENDDLYAVLSFEILKREWQKVWLRNYYS